MYEVDTVGLIEPLTVTDADSLTVELCDEVGGRVTEVSVEVSDGLNDVLSVILSDSLGDTLFEPVGMRVTVVYDALIDEERDALSDTLHEALGDALREPVGMRVTLVSVAVSSGDSERVALSDWLGDVESEPQRYLRDTVGTRVTDVNEPEMASVSTTDEARRPTACILRETWACASQTWRRSAGRW